MKRSTRTIIAKGGQRVGHTRQMVLDMAFTLARTENAHWICHSRDPDRLSGELEAILWAMGASTEPAVSSSDSAITVRLTNGSYAEFLLPKEPQVSTQPSYGWWSWVAERFFSPGPSS